jgi:hypothetical protein
VLPSSSSWNRAGFSSGFMSNRRACWICAASTAGNADTAVQILERTQRGILLTTDTPDLVAVGLLGGVHGAMVDVHVPRVARIVYVRRRRPLSGRLDIWSAYAVRFTNGFHTPSPFPESALPKADPRVWNTALLSAHAMLPLLIETDS